MTEAKKDQPGSLDALVAAPQHHTLLFENEVVRVLDTRISPGDQTNIHTHIYPASLYILSWSDFTRYDDAGKVVLNSREAGLQYPAGSVLWSGPLAPHSLKNTGDKPLHVISVEIKNYNP